MGEDDGLDDILDAWQSAAARGEDPPLADLCRGRTDLLPEAERRVADLRRVEGLRLPPADACPRPASRPASRPRPDASTRDPAGRSAASPDSTAPYEGAAATGDGEVAAPGYEVGGEIARGSMGRVLAARDVALGREVAIKVVLDKGAADPAARTRAAARFVRESRITGRLAHPNIPAVYRLGRLADGSPFLAMKLVRGRTLAALLAERPDVGNDLPRFVAIVEQVCQAVGYAHAQGIVHRDLKPANVMVGGFGEVQVMDWGLAKVLTGPGRDAPTAETAGPPPSPDETGGSTRAEERTEAGAVVGTPAYMAPEQARGEEADARADVFALGGLLAAVLVGRPPFASGSVASTLALASAGDTAAVAAALDGCRADAELVGVARRCLAPAAADRPADGTAVAGLVAAYRAGVEDRLRAAERDRAAAEARVAEQRKRRRAQLALAAAVVLLVAGAGGGAVWRVAEVARLEGEERDRGVRAAAGVSALLDQAEAALATADADRAAPFLDQADQRAAEAGGESAARLARCREALAVLGKLDEVDAYRWTPNESKLPSDKQVAARWAAVFAGFGVAPGKTAPATAADRVTTSPVQPTLLAALDGWLVRLPPDQADPVRAVLVAADDHPFRTEVRRTLTAGDKAALAALAARPEWEAQPPGLVRAFATVAAVPVEVRRAVLLRVAVVRPDDFDLVMDLGTTYRNDAAGETGQRVRWFQAAVGIRPRSAVAQLSLGQALHESKDFDGAVARFREAARLAPREGIPHFNVGNVLRDRKDWRGAEAAYREAVRLDPKYFPAHHDLGNALQVQKDYVGAVAAYREAIRFNPDHAGIRSNLALALSAAKDHVGAEAAYREAVRLDPNHANAHSELARLLLERNDPAGAEAAAREAVRLDPNHASAHSRLGRALLARGNPVGAEAACREATRLDPNSQEAHSFLGVVLYHRNEFRGSAAAFGEAVRLAPTSAGNHHDLGTALSAGKDGEGAEAAYREAIRLDPGHASAHYNLGIVLRARGDAAGAGAAFRESIRLRPEHAPAHGNLGLVLRDGKDFPGATAAFREVIRLNPKDADGHYNLGRVLDVMFDLDGAEAAYRETIRLSPGYAPTHVYLGDLLRKLGRADEAVAAYRAALAVQPTLGSAHNGLAFCLRVQRGEVPTGPPPRAVGR